MKIISTRARIASFLLAVLASAVVLGGTLIGLTEGDEAASSAVLVMERPAAGSTGAVN
jgi:hypothetical protein